MVIMNMQDATLLMPVIVGVLQAIKYALPESAKKFIPLLAILVGVVIAYFFGQSTDKENILLGILLGLSSVGFYQSGKAFYPSTTNDTNESKLIELTPEIGDFYQDKQIFRQ